jgi:ribosomal protein S18 acetylase RimI-like enzyme
VQGIHYLYHHPDYFCPEPYETYPSHLHIDLLERARGQGIGRRMMEKVMEKLRERGAPGAHLGLSAQNLPAFGFYQRLGFTELVRVDDVIYMGKQL